ncbi:conserved hypothetical protein [Histoplasma capsulatum H143]|uniref:Uncharacterized protein n=1 Tax=Ajellomyces capsulatus (strain H143) TaxID=544712 RepID=C6H414_AJECH|nr:conserved hypothetical protein [Histoplasma capsulatum H143]
MHSAGVVKTATISPIEFIVLEKPAGRRSAAAVQSPASPAWFDTRPITPGPDNLQAQCSQAKLGKLMPQHNNSASINHSNEEDNPAMMETLNCPQLQKLRSVQEAQRDRHLAFKEDTLESLYLRHEESKSLKRETSEIDVT